MERGKKPPEPADPRELDVRPNGENRVKVSFRGQPWPAVMEWLGVVSEMSVDWQQLPGDFLNLTMQREYTIRETRDLINRHLLTRGFTMLEQGDFLVVVNLKKLDPALVPRVAAEQLAAQQPHDFVKVSFRLEWMLASTAAEELKPMLSPHGKLVPLTATNRVEAMDAAKNLQDVFRVLQEEQSEEGRRDVVREFPLANARADEVVQHLRSFLGIEEKAAGPAMMSPEQMQMAQQQAMMMAQMQPPQPGQPGPPTKKNDQPIRLLANPTTNSVLVHAPIDKLVLISQAIERLDVPHSLAQRLQVMHVYRLAALDPAELVEAIHNAGTLQPQTRLQVDRTHRAIIAHASVDDHFTIRSLIEKLDGSGRKFQVIRLRRLDAVEVAGTIEYMMVGPPEKEKPRSRYIDFYPFGGSRGEQKDEAPQDKFRVDADLNQNRLLVWANEVETAQVWNFLEQLGEVQAGGTRGASPVRILDSIPIGSDGDAYLQRLQKAWSSISPNPLLLPDPLPGSSQQPSERGFDDNRPADDAAPPTDPGPSDQKEARQSTPRSNQATFRLTQLRHAAGPPRPTDSSSDPPSDSPAVERTPPSAPLPGNPPGALPGLPPGAPSRMPPATPAPIRITRTPDGRYVIASSDLRALDALEDLLMQLQPPRADYEIFHVQNAPAYWVMLNLEDFFKEDDDKNRRPRNPFWWDDMPRAEQAEERRRLSRQRKLKFISDLDTNTILVRGADRTQLRTIAELIELYDVPEPTNQKSARATRLFAIRYSKAKVIADVVKDAYRDLLSSNDKALLAANQVNQKPPSENTYITNFGGDDEKKERRTPVTFKGKLSIGVDELTNTLLVSAEGELLLESIGELITQLDTAARPVGDLQVIRWKSGGVKPDRLQAILAAMLGPEPPKSTPGPQPAATPSPLPAVDSRPMFEVSP